MAEVFEHETRGLAPNTMVSFVQSFQTRKHMATYWAIVILAVTSFAAQTVHAQNRVREQIVKVSGCIAQASRTGSLTDDTGAGNVPSPNTAGVEANSSEPVNAYLLLDATPPADGGGVQRDAGKRTSYALQGLASELANHKGHRVEIVGQLLPRLSPVSGPKSPAPAIQRISVQTVKMLSAQCETPQTR